VDENALVSMTSSDVEIVTLAIWSDKFTLPMTTDTSVNTMRAII
jgi:hypothetical protein